MIFPRFSAVILCAILALLSGLATAQSDLTDPYEILNRHVAATGGLERLKGELTQHIEGTLSVAGLTGSILIWTQKPDFNLTEVDLKVFRVKQGENAQGQWIFDSNGKLQLITKRDESSLKRKEVKRRMGEFEYLDKDSKTFMVTLAAGDTANASPCYVVQVANNLNDDIQKLYINKSTFMLERQISTEGEESSDNFYSDYRDVGGIKAAYYTKQISLRTGQVQEVTIRKYESNPKLDPAIFDPPQEEEADFRFTKGSSAENIPFKFRGNHIYIPVVVNCRERYWILDTGASISVVGSDFAKELGLELHGNMKGGASNSTVEIQFTTLPSYSVQGIEFDAQQVAALDMKPLNKLLDIEADGILGFDFLSRFVTKVDYAHELLSFYDPKSFTYSGDGNKLDVHLKDGVFMATAVLDGTHRGTWLCDLGASSSSLEGYYAKANGFLERTGVIAMGRGAGAAYRSKRVQCDSISFAGYVLKKPRLHFPIDNIDTVSAADEIGNIGNTVFRNFVLYVDYANEQMIVEQGDQFGMTFPEDRSGLQIMRGDEGGYEIWSVSPQTPAAKAGFVEGDKLTAINGIDVEQFAGISALRDLFSGAPGTKFEIAVKRGEKTSVLKLTLADLL